MIEIDTHLRTNQLAGDCPLVQLHFVALSEAHWRGRAMASL